MVKAVTWAGEAKKFYEENKGGKNGIHSFSDALKSPELKKQYKLAKKNGGGDGEVIEQSPDDGVNIQETAPQDQSPAQYDGGNEIEPQAPASTVMDGGNDDETPAAQMDGGKKKKSARRTKKSKKSKTIKKQRKHKK
jgi:hypothetical protein